MTSQVRTSADPNRDRAWLLMEMARLLSRGDVRIAHYKFERPCVPDHAASGMWASFREGPKIYVSIELDVPTGEVQRREVAVDPDLIGAHAQLDKKADVEAVQKVARRAGVTLRDTIKAAEKHASEAFRKIADNLKQITTADRELRRRLQRAATNDVSAMIELMEISDEAIKIYNVARGAGADAAVEMADIASLLEIDLYLSDAKRARETE